MPSQTSQTAEALPIEPKSLKMTPLPLQLGHAPAEFALNRAGFTPLALANAVRMESSIPV